MITSNVRHFMENDEKRKPHFTLSIFSTDWTKYTRLHVLTRIKTIVKKVQIFIKWNHWEMTNDKYLN